MPHAVVLNTASKAGAAGGVFADSLTANAGDSLAVANFNDGGARILEAWAIDSTSVAEFQVIYSRPQATHDQQHGFRFGIPSLVPGGAGKPAAHDVLPGLITADLYKSDVAIVQASCTAADNLVYAWVTEYDDLPGAYGSFIGVGQLQQLQVSLVGIQVTALANATVGAYGAQRAFNADDDRLHANTWYAILGYTFQTPVTVVSLLGPDWGGQRIGGPGATLLFHTASYFVDQSIKWNKPLIPCFNSNNRGNVLVQVADNITATSPKLDFLLYELSAVPNWGV